MYWKLDMANFNENIISSHYHRANYYKLIRNGQIYSIYRIQEKTPQSVLVQPTATVACSKVFQGTSTLTSWRLSKWLAVVGWSTERAGDQNLRKRLLYVGDHTTQLYRICNKPLWTKLYNWMSIGFWTLLTWLLCPFSGSRLCWSISDLAAGF